MYVNKGLRTGFHACYLACHQGETRLSTIWNNNNSTILNELSKNDHNHSYQKQPRPLVAAKGGYGQCCADACDDDKGNGDNNI